MPNNMYETEPKPATPTPTSQEQNDSPAPSEQSFPDTSTGQLVVSVFTANQLYPVVNAQVTVTEENSEEVIASGTTDRSGRTTLFSLPAPSSSASQEPTVRAPFSEYKVTVTHPDFFKAVIENVQIFGSIITQLPVNLVPLPEIQNNNIDNIVIIPRQNL